MASGLHANCCMLLRSVGGNQSRVWHNGCLATTGEGQCAQCQGGQSFLGIEIRNGDAGIVFPNGTLSPLGELYNSFAAGSNKTEINITMPEWKWLIWKGV